MHYSIRALGAVMVTLAMVLSAVPAPLAEQMSAADAAAAADAGAGSREPGAGTRGYDGGRGGEGGHGGGEGGSGGGEGGGGNVMDRASARADGAPSIIYAILCPAAFADALAPLQEWKTKKGMNAGIYTLEEMLTAYSGPSEVKDFVKVHQYLRRLWQNNSELKWVLVVGDGDADGETFPVPYIFTNASHDLVMGDDTVLDDVPSDVMYSGLEKSWDSNNNRLYGEPGEADWTPEAYVGRWPSKTVAEVELNVNRVLKYEKYPTVGGWMSTALLAGALYDIPNILDPGSDPNKWNDKVFDWPHDNGRTVMLKCADQLPAGMDKTFLLDYDQQYGGNYTNEADTLSPASFIAALNAGCSVVATASHGWISGNGINQYYGNGSDPNNRTVDSYSSYLYWTNAQSLSNVDSLPLMYSSACDVANFTTYWHSDVGENRDRTLEQLLKNPGGGAIGFISATNGDYWNPKDGNWWLEENFWKQFSTSFRPGEALYLSKVAYDNYFKSNGWNNELSRVRQNKAIYILLGDPEVPIWTDTPGTLSVEGPARLVNALQTVIVTVNDSITGQPVRNAMVAFSGAGTFARGFTDGTGTARVAVAPVTTGMMNLTVTAHNYLPNEGQSEVVLAPPDLTLSPEDITLSVPDAVIRAGEQVTVSAVVRNIGGLAASGVAVEFYNGSPSTGAGLIGTFTVASLPSRQNATASVTWTAGAETRSISVAVDRANAIAELDETNNQASKAVTVSAWDLTLSGTDMTASPMVLLDEVPCAASGAAINLTATVHNQGSAAALSVYVRFYDGDPAGNGTPIEGDKRIEQIDAGGIGNASVRWNKTELAGPHQLFVLADPMNFMVEYDETNNAANITLRLDAPPAFTQAVPPVSTDEDRSLNSFLDIQQYVEDPDTDISALRFRVVSSTVPEANLTISEEGLVSLRPYPDWNGAGEATIGVTDGVSETTAVINVTVRPVNDPPVIELIPDATMNASEYFIYTVNATDPDIAEGDYLTFSAETVLFAINKTSGKIIYNPSASDVGKHNVKITVTDKDGLSSSTYWKFTVVKANSPPQLQLPANPTLLAVETRAFYFKVNATHADSDPPVFSVDTSLFTINPNTGEISFTPAKGSHGIYAFNVTVRDFGGLSDRRQMTLEVKELPITDGGEDGISWLVYLILIVVAAACIGVAAVLAGRIRSREARPRAAAGTEKARYEAKYGAGTYEYALKGNSSSLREFREAERRRQAEGPRRCPKCRSDRVQVFEDGGAICNKCGNTFK